MKRQKEETEKGERGSVNEKGIKTLARWV